MFKIEIYTSITKVKLIIDNCSFQKGFNLYSLDDIVDFSFDITNVQSKEVSEIYLFKNLSDPSQISNSYFQNLKIDIRSKSNKSSKLILINIFGSYKVISTLQSKLSLVIKKSEIYEEKFLKIASDERMNDIDITSVDEIQLDYLQCDELMRIYDENNNLLNSGFYKYDNSSYILEKIKVYNFNELLLKGVTSNSLIIISDNHESKKLDVFLSYFKQLQILNVNLECLKLDNICSIGKSGTNFSLQNIRFKEASFYKVEFKEFKNFISRNINLEAASFIACSNPNINRTEYFDYKEVYETYRQLKTAYQKNNNKLLELEAHAKMFEAAKYRTDLSDWDKFILCMNHFSNRNGISIEHAIKTIVLILISSFIVLVISSIREYDYSSICDFFRVNIYERRNLIFTILNPLSRSDEFARTIYPDSKNVNFSFIQNFWIFLSKIGISWAIYQFVVAFRKFGKQ